MSDLGADVGALRRELTRRGLTVLDELVLPPVLDHGPGERGGASVRLEYASGLLPDLVLVARVYEDPDLTLGRLASIGPTPLAGVRDVRGVAPAGFVDALVTRVTHLASFLDPASPLGETATGGGLDLDAPRNSLLARGLAATLAGPLAHALGRRGVAESAASELLGPRSWPVSEDVASVVSLGDSATASFLEGGVSVLEDLAAGVPAEWALRRERG